MNTPKDLDPFEAALASLVPRDDCLDHELILFRAGQMSVASQSNGRARFVRSRAWPVLAATMTAVSAVLLVTLLLQPEPRVVQRIRYVEVAAEPRGENAAAPVSGSEGDGRPRLASGTAPGDETDRSPSAEPPWPRTRAAYLESFQRMLQEDVMPEMQPVTTASSADRRRADPPSYRQRLKAWLDNPDRMQPWRDLPDIPLYQGARS